MNVEARAPRSVLMKSQCCGCGDTDADGLPTLVMKTKGVVDQGVVVCVPPGLMQFRHQAVRMRTAYGSGIP